MKFGNWGRELASHYGRFGSWSDDWWQDEGDLIARCISNGCKWVFGGGNPKEYDDEIRIQFSSQEIQINITLRRKEHIIFSMWDTTKVPLRRMKIYEP